MVEVEFRSINQTQSCVGNYRVKVTQTGALFYARNTQECRRGEDWSSSWPSEPSRQLSATDMQGLQALVQGGGVLELPARVTDPARATSGGHREEVDIRIGDVEHRVVVDNTSAVPVDALRRLLLGWVATG